MARVRVSTVIDASPAQVWAEVRNLERHVDWMADAVELTFDGPQRSGVGTTFDCDTKVGPFRLTDRMVVTEWHDGQLIGVRHHGLVTGSGRFLLSRTRRGRTRFAWDERLTFPWWMGGAPGAAVGSLVMRRIWKRNLAVLKALVESGRS